MTVFTHLLRVMTGDSNQNLRNTQEHAERTERALRNLESRAGRVGSAAGRLSGGLGRISPELSELAMFTNDAADGLEVLSMGGAKALRILGPVAAAAGVAAGAYMILKKRLDEANQAMKEANELARRNQELFEEVSRVQNLAAVAAGQMTVEELNRINAMDAGQRLFQERRQALEDQLDAARNLRDAEVENFNRIASSSAQAAQSIEDENKRALFISVTTQRLEEQTTALEDAQQTFRLAEFNLENLNNQQSEYIDNLQTIANKNENVAVSNEDVADSVEKVTEALRKQMALSTVDPSAITGVTPDLGQLLPTVQTADILERDRAVTDAMIREARQQALGGVADAVNIAGSPARALSMLGPAGAIFGGLAQIGAAGGASGVEKQLDTLIDNVTDGILALPEILSDVIPEFVNRLVAELPPALARAIGEIMIDLFNSLPGVNIGDQADLTAAEKIERQELLNFLNIGGEKGGSFFFGVDQALEQRDSREAASRGRMARADGARRMAMSRAPTAQIMGSPSLTINALGIDDGTQDQFQRRFARYTDPNTGLRGRDG